MMKWLFYFIRKTNTQLSVQQIITLTIPSNYVQFLVAHKCLITLYAIQLLDENE